MFILHVVSDKRGNIKGRKKAKTSLRQGKEPIEILNYVTLIPEFKLGPQWLEAKVLTAVCHTHVCLLHLLGSRNFNLMENLDTK